MKQHFITKQQIPLVMEPKGAAPSYEEFLAYIRENRESIRQLTLQHTGVLFRGFPIEGAEGFNGVVEALDFGSMLDYVGGDSPRDKVKGKVYTSTEAPPTLKIPLHNEMSFIKNYPRHIYFFCHIPAEKGGATILGDARQIFKSVDPKVREKFENKGLRYVSNYWGKSLLFELINKVQRGHKSWIDVLQTNSREEAEKICKESAFGCKWRGSWLEISQDAPATIKHAETGDPIWFNQAHLYDFNPRLIGLLNWLGTKLVYLKPHTIMHEIFYGSGEKIAKQDLYHVMDVLDQNTIAYPWQKHDFLVLDNVLVMHGRAPFSGKRKIFTALTR